MKYVFQVLSRVQQRWPLIIESEYFFGDVFLGFFGWQHFEELVKTHFRERASLILDSCHRYCEGALVGSLSEHGGAQIGRGVEEGAEESSQGFRLVLTKLVPKLEEALELNKVGCDLGSVAVGGDREAVSQNG